MSALLERLIIDHLVADLLAKGALLGVNDGEETTLKHSADPVAIKAAMFTTDEDWLLVWPAGDHHQRSNTGWVRLIYGNGEDLISDYSTNLEALIAPTNAWIEKGAA
jgi:hypothetical protein